MWLQTFEGSSSLPELSDEYLNNKAVLETGFAIWMLFKNLMDHDPTIAIALTPHSHDNSANSSYARALAFFERHTKSVEIKRVRAGGGGRWRWRSCPHVPSVLWVDRRACWRSSTFQSRPCAHT